MKIIECPRDAMQGLQEFVPTDQKVTYLNQIFKVGFDTVDFGSFVSPKAIPQMRDTAEVLSKLNLDETYSHLLAIVANKRGAEDALQFEEIDYLGFPLSISETFQRKNTNKSIEEALQEASDIMDLCVSKNREMVAYVSMGFGNPYGEPFNAEITIAFVEKLVQMGFGIISLADTIGSATPALITEIFEALIPAFPDIEFGAHFHSHPKQAYEKIEAAYDAGCERIDGAIGGMGGCPMAKDELVGNIPTEIILKLLHDNEEEITLDLKEFKKAMDLKKK
ncbi:MAG: hydroxymethylglutaryl-CoA lyase, partial [Flammeovirgaceae bacterium]|nr:hydroxymethylglutaryl-CoA lyase [Flammeovirgaceae bacterium]MDW8287288.1 hydroxymethylglutaryl-CoA lyase [Flammeovirgaceae bacterium]